MSLCMLVPSRGRPENLRELLAAVRATTDAPAPLVVVCVDSDDPTLGEYQQVVQGADDVRLVVGEPSRIGPILNREAPTLVDEFTHIGFLGDDHRPRTPGWDKELCTDAVAYGNDLIQGHLLATAVVINSRIIKELGYFVPPGAWHLYFDNAWLDMGKRYGLEYRHDIVIEHMHPIAGKAKMDASYMRSNAGEVYEHDAEVYKAWRTEFLG